VTAARRVRRPYAGRRIVLGVSGGIAAYKAIQLARDLTLAGAQVDVILTAGGLDFVRPLSFEAVTGRRVWTEPYQAGDPLRHIRLAREADLVIVAPATANVLARAAGGFAEDLLGAILLATDAPVLLCPAMNDRMFAHPQTQANLVRLRQIGYCLAGPGVGPLAFGEGEGPGRLLEPDEIIAHAGRSLEGETPLSGVRLIVTAGPTREAIDPVRFLGNRSSGRMGYSLAAAAWRRGAEVTLISGPSALTPPIGPELISVESAVQMHDALRDALPEARVLIMAAAVADFRVRDVSDRKIKRRGEAPPRLQLEENPDILRATRALRPTGCVTVGFALETDDALENGRAKLVDKDLDLLVVNDAREPGAGFEVPTNRVTLLARAGEPEELPLLPKEEVADAILDRVGAPLSRHAAGS
jgi:phosphopantothenoylcysteine decarboxylase / phosphopantothenate---cysteine ligase